MLSRHHVPWFSNLKRKKIQRKAPKEVTYTKGNAQKGEKTKAPVWVFQSIKKPLRTVYWDTNENKFRDQSQLTRLEISNHPWIYGLNKKDRKQPWWIFSAKNGFRWSWKMMAATQVDIYSSNDDYSPAIWRAASQWPLGKKSIAERRTDMFHIFGRKCNFKLVPFETAKIHSPKL